MENFLNITLILSVLSVFLVSCNIGGGSSTEISSISDKQVIPDGSKSQLTKLPRSNSNGAITSMINLNDVSDVAWTSGVNLQNYSELYNCGNMTPFVNMVKVDNSGDIVAVDSNKKYYTISGFAQSHTSCTSASFNNTTNNFPLAFNKGFVTLGDIDSNGVGEVKKTPWNNLQNTIFVWHLKFSNKAKYIDVDKYDDMLVVSSENSGNVPSNNIYYTQYNDPKLHFYDTTSGVVTAAKLVPINYNGNVVRIAFWAYGNQLSYTNINAAVFGHNPEQTVHSMFLPSSDNGFITKIDFYADSNDLILVTSTNHVYKLSYKIVPFPNNDYMLNVSISHVYNISDDSDKIITFVKGANDSFFIGTEKGNLYANISNLPADSDLGSPYNTAGIVPNECGHSFISKSGNIYKKCMYNIAGAYSISTPVFANYISTYGYGGGGGAGVSCGHHSGSSGGSGVKVSSMNNNVTSLNYVVQVGGGGGGSTHWYYGGGGGGGGYSTVCAGNSCELSNMLNIAGGGGGGGLNCQGGPNPIGGDAGKSGFGIIKSGFGISSGSSSGGGAGESGNGGNGGWGDCGGNGGNGSSWIGGNGVGMIGNTDYAYGGWNGGGEGTSTGSSRFGGGGGGGGYGGGGGGGNGYGTPYGPALGGGGGGGGGNYSVNTTDIFDYSGSSAGNGGPSTGYDYEGKNGYDGYELVLFSSFQSTNN